MNSQACSCSAYPKGDTGCVTEHLGEDCQGRAWSCGTAGREAPGLKEEKGPAGQWEEGGQRPRGHDGMWTETMRRGGRDPRGQQLADHVLDSSLAGNSLTGYPFVKEPLWCLWRRGSHEGPMDMGAG